MNAPPRQDDDDEEDNGEEPDEQDAAGDMIMAVMGGAQPDRKGEKRWTDGQDRMEEELMRHGASHHVTEIYSPPRVTVWVDRMRLAPGLAFDLTQKDPEDGKPWDFNDPTKAAKAKR